MNEKEEKFGIVIMKITLILLFLVFSLNGCSYFNKKLQLKDDNILEEVLEGYIEKEIGIDIDLSHDTPEG